MSRSLPCPALEAALHAYADRELGEAEAARVEAHLEQCAGCVAALREVEAVGAVLKQWERQQAPAAPPRLARNVLAQVREEQAAAAPGPRRVRRAPRAARRPAFAWAAAALLLVGVGVLGARLAAPPPPPEPFTPSVATLPPGPQRPAPAPAPVEVQPLPRDLLARAPLRALELPGGPEGLPEGVSREAFLAGALDAQRTLEMELEFERRVGVRGVWIVDVQDGVERRLLVTPAAAEAFAPEDLVAWLRARAAETASAAPAPATSGPGPVPARALAARLAPVPASAPVFQLGREGSAQGVLLRVRAVPRAAGAAGQLALDPLVAVREGVLRLEPDDTREGPPAVVALVRGAAQPLWMPAGQLLSTPAGDMALAQAAWLPAGAGETRWRLACVPVSAGVARPGPVRLLPFVAPPALRHALLEDEPALRVRELLARWRLGGSAADVPGGWSLLELYDEAAELARVQELARVAAQLPGGFVAADGEERALGLELPGLAGPAQEALVARLLHGYAWQALRGLALARGPGLSTFLAALAAEDRPLAVLPPAVGAAGDGLERARGRGLGWRLAAHAAAGDVLDWQASPAEAALPGPR